MEESQMDYEWPGWPIEEDPHGREFDLKARKRMIMGSEILLPFIYNYKKESCKFILEVGPFFNPLITVKNFPNKHICYWENDLHVLKWLQKQNKTKYVNPIYCDLNKIEGDSYITLKKETMKYFKKYNKKDKLFDCIVVSQLLNYIDYKLFFIILKNFIRKDGLIFINNVIDYGIPSFFSDKRPKNVKSMKTFLEELGYEIIEEETIETPNKKSQKHDRIILVLKNTN